MVMIQILFGIPLLFPGSLCPELSFLHGVLAVQLPHAYVLHPYWDCQHILNFLVVFASSCSLAEEACGCFPGELGPRPLPW